MPELNERDLSRLFKSVGHEAPGNDLSARIMARVAVTTIARPVPVKPLIGPWGWAGIAAFVMGAVLLGLFSGVAGGGSEFTYLSPVLDMISGIELPKGDWPLWMIGISFLALLFLGIDRALDSAGVQRGRS
jgi:hypothetical protein